MKPVFLDLEHPRLWGIIDWAEDRGCVVVYVDGCDVEDSSDQVTYERGYWITPLDLATAWVLKQICGYTV